MNKQQTTPELLRTLKPNQQLQKVTLLFFEKAANNLAFINGKPTQSFWKFRSYIGERTVKKNDLSSLHLLYDFLWQYDGVQKLSLSDCFEKAREYQERLRWKDKGDHKGAYEDYRKLLSKM